MFDTCMIPFRYPGGCIVVFGRVPKLRLDFRGPLVHSEQQRRPGRCVVVCCLHHYCLRNCTSTNIFV